MFALPPLATGRVCDLASGNGNAAVKIKAAYPRQSFIVVNVVIVVVNAVVVFNVVNAVDFSAVVVTAVVLASPVVGKG